MKGSMLGDLYLTPLSGVVLVFVVVVCGHLYRQNWKTQPPNARLRAWLFGVPAALGLLALAFLPLKY
ncbi:hypothetical protein [Cribrihabitans neustonicus]|uniref:hypothetical protein n=1 Tax=Cribrihabitans neustonicus TaxID=1429085 RepID=UPI003B5B85DA